MVRLLAIIPFAIAAIVIAGWAFGEEALKRAGLSSVTMNPAAALALLFIGAGLCAGSCSGRKAATLGAVLIGSAGCIGAIKLVDLIFGTHFGIDAILFASQLSAGYVFPSRMAPNTAGSLVVISTALLLMRGRSARAVVTAQALACLASLVAIFTVVGHLYGVAAFYVVGAMHPMALHAAAAFLSLSGFIMLPTAALWHASPTPAPPGDSAERCCRLRWSFLSCSAGCARKARGPGYSAWRPVSLSWSC